jgi:hypothetical protein
LQLKSLGGSNHIFEYTYGPYIFVDPKELQEAQEQAFPYIKSNLVPFNATLPFKAVPSSSLLPTPSRNLNAVRQGTPESSRTPKLDFEQATASYQHDEGVKEIVKTIHALEEEKRSLEQEIVNLNQQVIDLRAKTVRYSVLVLLGYHALANILS